MSEAKGLPSQIEVYAKALNTPHSTWMKANLGFDIEDAFAISKAIISTIEHKFNSRLAEGRIASAKAKAEYENLLSTNPNDLLPEQALFAEKIRSIGLEEAGTAYGTFFVFGASKEVLGMTPTEIAERMGENEPSVRLSQFLERMSQAAGELDGVPDSLGLQSPLKAPIGS